MDFILSIVGKVTEYAVAPAIRQVGYVINCNSERQVLKAAVDKLNAAREGVHHKITEALNKGDQKTEAEVKKWLVEVGKITIDANELTGDDIQAKMICLHGLCPNVKLRHKLGRDSTKLKLLVENLLAEKEFSTVSYNVRPQEPCLISTPIFEAFDSRESTINKIMDELRDPSDNFIVVYVYGVGGVGKTTLVEEVFRRAHEDKIFVEQIMVQAAEKLDLAKIQKEIARQLGVEVRQDEDMEDLARRICNSIERRICNSIKDKRILVILDNMLEKFDLKSLGIPCLPTCRIVLTSRTRDVLCSGKWSPKEFRLEVLDGNDSWSLFKSLFKIKARNHILNDRAIESVAREVVKKCGGLPVLIVAVAGALKNRDTPHAWKEALRNLQQYVNQNSIEEAYSKAYSGLEWSYNQLNDEKNLKPLLLLCGMLQYTEGGIVLSHLLKYAMGLSLLKNVSTVEDANDALYTRIEELKDACLLLDTEYKSSVRMHDLICDVTIRIASRNQRALLRARGDELKEWPSNKEFSEKCTKISLSCSNVPKLPEVLECQELQLFQYVSSWGLGKLKISDSFFKELRKLMVLNLTSLHLSSLPTSLVFLKNLETLCLHDCKLEDIALVGQLTTLEVLSFVKSHFKELPKEIGNLTRLRLLDLTESVDLRVIAPGVISGLKSLEDLRMRDCDEYTWKLEGLLELKELSHVAALEINIVDLRMVPMGLFSDKLKRYNILIGDEWEWDNVDQNENTLMIGLTGSCGFESIQTLLERSKVLCLDGKPHEIDVGDIFSLFVVSTIIGSETLLEESEVLCLDEMNRHEIDDANIGQLITSAITREVVLTNLTSLTVHNCDRLKALFTYPMATSLVELQYLEVDSCGMEEIVYAKEQGDENADAMFPKLQCVVLKNLEQLSRFSGGSNIPIEFPSLKHLRLSDCPNLETFILDPKSERTYSLFNDKVACPRLQEMRITGSDKLKTIWSHNQLAPGSFCELNYVKVKECAMLINIFGPSIIGRLDALQKLDVKYCHSLRHVLPCSVATDSLQRLQSLKVKNCDEMKEIVAKEEGSETTMPTFLFARLVSLEFEDLPRLESFYPGIHASEWPLLKTFEVLRCEALEIVLMGVSGFQKHDELGGSPTSIKQSFFSVNKSDGNGDAAFPQLRVLSIKAMPKLIYVCKDDSSSAHPFFPNLQELQVVGCVRLKDLGSSTLPFQYLTSLEVNCCHSLTHLMTYATAKSSMRLRKMTVANCKRMTEVVTTSDGDDGQIAFSQLEKLILYNLPSLQDFCSGNCTVKFPSLKSLLIENCCELKINCLEWKMSPELQEIEMMKKDDNLRFLDYWNREYPTSINEVEEDNGQ